MIEKLRTQRATWARSSGRRPQAIARSSTSTARSTASRSRAAGQRRGHRDRRRASARGFRRGAARRGGGRDRTRRCRSRNYPAKNLAGKTAKFAINVKRVEEQVLPELDDKFAASFGVSTGKVEDLAAEVRKNMERELAERLSTRHKARAFDALIKRTIACRARSSTRRSTRCSRPRCERWESTIRPGPVARAFRITRAAARDRRAADPRAYA